jgi:hypothetical protein
VFVASPHADLTWHLITAADRVTYHVVPATALLLAVAIARVRRPERC